MDGESLPGDASTLIYLAKADAFKEARACVEGIIVPPSVWQEAVEGGERIHAPEVERINQAFSDGFLRRVGLPSELEALAETIRSQHRLGRGESEVLAVGTRSGRAIVDEGRATRVAASLGIVAISTLFLPVLGLRSGRLERGQASALLRRLVVATGATAEVLLELEQHLREENDED